MSIQSTPSPSDVKAVPPELSPRPIARLTLPYGKTLEALQPDYPGSLALLRLRIREGRRFTVIDLDPDTARALATLLGTWAGPA